MKDNPMRRLGALSQSIWRDYICRDLILSGGLRRLIEEEVRGMSSNPAIFEKAIAGSIDSNVLALWTICFWESQAAHFFEWRKATNLLASRYQVGCDKYE